MGNIFRCPEKIPSLINNIEANPENMKIINRRFFFFFFFIYEMRKLNDPFSIVYDVMRAEDVKYAIYLCITCDI